MKQVTIKYIWRCGLCPEEAVTFSEFAIPIGWYRLDGWRRIPAIIYQEGKCPSPPRDEKIICNKCAHIVKSTLDFTETPYHMAKAQTGWDKPIAPGMITLMG